MRFKKVFITVIYFLLFPVFLLECTGHLSESDKKLIIRNQMNYISKLEDERIRIWNNYSDNNGFIEFCGYLDINSNTYKASQELKKVISTYKSKIIAESNKVDKNKVNDSEFLEYLNNIDEYIFAVNDYAHAMKYGDFYRFDDTRKDLDKYRKLVENYAQKELNN